MFESENFTVSAWVKYDALGGSNNVDTNNQIIVGKESYELGVDNQGVPYFNIQNDTIINNLTNDSYTVLLDIGGAGDADSSHIGYETNIYRKDDAYEMWTGCHNGSSWFVCYANSSDSISWSKYASNPVLDLGANGQWDDFGVLPIDVIVDEGYYHMWYFGFNGF